MQQEEGPAYGAAILAGVGAGAFSDIPSACDRFIKEDKTIQWNETEAAKYRQYHQIYDRIYEHLKTDFSALAKT